MSGQTLYVTGQENTDNWEVYGFLSLLFPVGLALYRSGLAQRKNSIVILATPFIHISVGTCTVGIRFLDTLSPEVFNYWTFITLIQ